MDRPLIDETNRSGVAGKKKKLIRFFLVCPVCFLRLPVTLTDGYVDDVIDSGNDQRKRGSANEPPEGGRVTPDRMFIHWIIDTAHDSRAKVKGNGS
jgi:hypothetical protein